MNKHAKYKENVVALTFVMPALLLLLAFLILPFCLSIGYSLTDYYLLKPKDINFIGLKNFIRLSTDEIFIKSVFNTFYFVVLVVPLQLSLGLALALMVKNNYRGVSFFRTAFFSPTIMSLMVISILWFFIYNPNNGLLNSVLANFGIAPQPFLTSAKQAMNSIIVMSAWQGAGFQMIIFLAGLHNIPIQLYEAAKIDGAGRWQTFIKITLPSLKNTIVFLLLTITILAFQLLIQPMTMTQGGPLNSTTTIFYQMYQTGYKYREMGYGCAMTVFYAIIVLVIAFVQKWLLRDKD